MRVAFVYANSWETHYPHVKEDFNRRVWGCSDDFIMKYPRAVMNHGLDPVLIFLTAPGSMPCDIMHKYGFQMRGIPSRWWPGRFDREWSFRLFKEVSRTPFDLLHIYQYYRNRRWPDVYDALAAFCRFHRIPFVAHYQGGEFPRAHPSARVKKLLLSPRRWVKKRALQKAERILVINRLEQERLTDSEHPDYCGYTFPREKIVWVPNIVDQDLFAPMDRDQACAEAGLDTQHRYLLYVGHLRAMKGVQDLVEVLPRLLSTHPGLRLIIVGSGSYEDTLRKQVQDLDLVPHVFFQGPVENRLLKSFYNLCEALVLPSYTEGLPSVLLEGLACGAQIVGTTVGGVPDLLADGVGLVVEPGTPPALCQAVEQILSGTFRASPEVCMRRVEEHSYRRAGEILMPMYREILETQSPRSTGEGTL